MHNIMTKKEKRLKSCLEIKEKKILLFLFGDLAKQDNRSLIFLKKTLLIP